MDWGTSFGGRGVLDVDSVGVEKLMGCLTEGRGFAD